MAKPYEQPRTISNWLRLQLELDAASAIDLGTNEQILHVTGPHVIVLLGRLILPLLSLVFWGGMAIYRATGGGFVVANASVTQGFDLLNWAMVVMMLLLGLIWLALAVRGRVTSQTRLIIALIMAALGLLSAFRASGGRIFYHNAQIFFDQAFDGFNIVLIILSALSLIATIFTAYDWLNDELILTNQRVVYDDDQVIIPFLIERRQQQQIFLEDVQDVLATTETYAKHWLGYGTIQVKSARLNGDIRFVSAREPMLMQQKIMGEVRALRKTLSAQNFERLVADHIYGQKAPTEPPQLRTRETRVMRWLRWLVPDNPEMDEQSSTITWRPHWIFLLRGLMGPLLLLVVASLALTISTNLLLLSSFTVAIMLSLIILVVLCWSFWEWEDYRNDRYILTPEKVVDIEKKPFGPEDRREAGMGAVNNISLQTTYVSNLLGYGDVVLTTAGGGTPFTFCRVPQPRDVVAKITEYNVRFKRADQNRSLNDMLGLLRHYHEAQLAHDEINRPSL